VCVFYLKHVCLLTAMLLHFICRVRVAEVREIICYLMMHELCLTKVI